MLTSVRVDLERRIESLVKEYNATHLKSKLKYIGFYENLCLMEMAYSNTSFRFSILDNGRWEVNSDYDRVHDSEYGEAWAIWSKIRRVY